MPKIIFKTENLSIDVEKGLFFISVDENYTTPLLFGCTEGNCGTCKIDIIENPESLTPMEEEERRFLISIDAKPSERLACQCKINGDITIELADFGNDEIF